MFCDADRRYVEPHTDVARDAEQGGMKSTVTVDQQDVGRFGEPADGRFDSRKLPIGEIRWDVGKGGAQRGVRDFDGPQICGADAHDRRVHPFAFVRQVDPRDALRSSSRVGFDYLRLEVSLLAPQHVEQANRLQGLHEPFRRHAAPEKPNAFDRESFALLGDKGPSVRPHDAVCASQVRMLHHPQSHRPRGADIA